MDNVSNDVGGSAVKKKTLGRRKIPIEKIKKKTNLQVTFTKRRKSFFRNAAELNVLCGIQIAIIVRSQADRIFTFGDPEPLIARFHIAAGDLDQESPPSGL